MSTILLDLKHAVRSLSKNPRFSAVAVLTLALGIGATTSLFSVLYAVLLRELPYRDPQRLYQLNVINLQAGRLSGPTSPLNFLDWRSRSHSFEYLGAYQSNVPFSVRMESIPERIVGARISDTLIPTLGIEPAIGRSFVADEDRKGSPDVVVLSQRLWMRYFNRDPKTVGQTITLSGRPYTVAGVMPAEFNFPTMDTDVWIPFGSVYEGAGRGNFFVQVIGRLKPDVSSEQAQAEMSSIADALEKDYPNTNLHLGVGLVPLREQVTGKVRPVLIAVMCGVAVILLIACVNVANLQLARSAAQRKQIAIRSALGASRMRIARHLLLESLVVSATAGGVGLFVAYWSVAVLVGLSPQDIPRISETRIDIHVLYFTLAVAMGTGVLFGLAPAWHASKVNLIDQIKGTPAKTGRRSLASGSLVASEIALAVVLLVAAGLLFRSFTRVLAVRPGFNTQNILKFDVTLPFPKYRGPQAGAFFQQAVERIQTIPGVRSAAATTVLPLNNENNARYFTADGRTGNSPQDYTLTDHRAVTADYFATLEIPIVKGRPFAATDFENSALPVVIVNQSFVHTFLHDEQAIGKRLKMGETADSPFPWMTIIGIATDVKHVSLEASDRPEIYRPYSQLTNMESELKMSFVVRSAQTAPSLTNVIRREIQALDPDQPIANVGTMAEMLNASVARRRFTMTLLVVFAVIALVLAFVGISGVVSFSVSQSTREIGIRVALGGRSSDVLKLFIGRSLKVAAGGVAAGIVVALGMARFIASLLFGVKPNDGGTFAVAAAVALGATVLAAYFPARKASVIDPRVALTQD